MLVSHLLRAGMIYAAETLSPVRRLGLLSTSPSLSLPVFLSSRCTRYVSVGHRDKTRLQLPVLDLPEVRDYHSTYITKHLKSYQFSIS